MQKVITRPVFERERDEEFKSQVEKLVESKLSEKAEIDRQKLETEKQRLETEKQRLETEKQKSAKEKLDEIKKGLRSVPVSSSGLSTEHVHDAVVGLGDCPTCRGHTLTIKEDTAKCTGPNCGKEFLLVEKVKNIEKDKKKYVCATCGHSVSKAEAEKIKDKDVCPLCGVGKAFFDLAWDKLDAALKNRNEYTKV